MPLPRHLTATSFAMGSSEWTPLFLTILQSFASSANDLRKSSKKESLTRKFYTKSSVLKNACFFFFTQCSTCLTHRIGMPLKDINDPLHCPLKPEYQRCYLPATEVILKNLQPRHKFWASSALTRQKPISLLLEERASK